MKYFQRFLFKLLQHKKGLTIAAIAPFLLFLSIDFLFPFRVNVDYAQVITSTEGKPLFSFLNKTDKWRMKASLEELPPELIQAVLYKEDRFFYYHPGVNLIAIAKAFTKNMIEGRTASGASTITMQVARLLEPKPRTYGNKVLEIVRALQLEWHFSKNEILMLYLNLVPYGGNIEGVKAASLLYFGVEPNQLSLAQSVVLAIVPNRPTSLALGKRNSAILEARNRWLRHYQAAKVFPEEFVEEALTEPLEAFRRAGPQIAPHFCYKVHRENPLEPIVRTTLQYEIQQQVQALSHQYIQRTSRFGVYNASVVVADNHTHQIVAYVGNPNFQDDEHAGQVDGTHALRSPGSTFKPFVYALAFDQGLYTPQSVLHDVPTTFSGYNPQNFDMDFQGKVTLKDALANSLNVVAVQTLEKIGVPTLIQTLERADFASITRSKFNLGLSLALGGCGVRLIEMAGLYSALANQGHFVPLRYLANTTAKDSSTLISPEAAYMVTEILSEMNRPDLPNEYLMGRKVPKIAWKTGTSYGRKDAWSIGYNQNYTIAVWLGNFDGKGARALTGAEMATPLLFKIFNSIGYNKQKTWYHMPETLKERVVCQESGLPPSEHCTKFISDYFIPTVSDIRTCAHMQLYWVSEDESERYCPKCLPISGYKKKPYPNHPAELLSFYKQTGIPYESPPPHHITCRHIGNVLQSPPNIVSPLEGNTYILEEASTQLMLQCHAAHDVKEVYWYLNNRFIAKAKPEERVFFIPPKGKIKISCSDDRGRNSDSYITIE